MSYKYRSLSKYLQESDKDMLRKTFKEVESLIEGKLPLSAWEHRAWWSNSTTHSHARHGWLDAGYETAQVDLDKEELIFVRQSAPSVYAQIHQKKKSSRAHRSRSRNPASLDAMLAEVVREAGGVENLHVIVEAIQQYIAGDLLETELGQVLRRHWPRGI